MKKSHLMVLDIDGTLLENGAATEGLGTLSRLVERHRRDVALVYATGRSFQSTWKLVEEGVLPRPAAVAAFIGTEIWLPDWFRPDPFYRELVRHRWNRDTVTLLARRIPGLVLQDEQFQTPLKVSFEIEQRSKVFDLKQILDKSHIDTRVVYSCGRYLDVVPKVAGKRKAVEFLSHYFRVRPQNILTCGDSGNDRDMLSNPHTANVVVANYEKELRNLRGPRLYRAARSFAAGVLEGAAAHHFWPRSTASDA